LRTGRPLNLIFIKPTLISLIICAAIFASPSSFSAYKIIDLHSTIQCSTIAKHVGHLRPLEIKFISAYCNVKNKKWSEAEQDLKLLKNSNPIISDYVLYYRAVSANGRGHYSDALTFLDEIKKHYPQSVWIKKSSCERGKALFKLGRYANASKYSLKCLKTISTAKKNSMLMNKISILALARYGDTEHAIKLIKKLILKVATRNELNQLLSITTEIGKETYNSIKFWIKQPEQRIIIAQSLYKNSMYKDSSIILTDIIKTNRSSDKLIRKAKYLLAACYKKMHEYDASLNILKILYSTERRKLLRSKFLSKISLLYSKKGYYKKAIEIRKQEFKTATKRTLASLANRIAILYMNSENYRSSLYWWKKAFYHARTRRAKARAYWFIGWCHYKLGEYSVAISKFNAITKSRYHRYFKARLLYWKAVSLQKLKQNAKAIKVFRKLIQSYPYGYYSMLAYGRTGLKPNNAALFYTPLESYPSISISQYNAIHLQRAKFFSKLGIRELLYMELKQISTAQNRNLSKSVIKIATKNKLYDIAYRISGNFFKRCSKINPNRGGYCLKIWKNHYPQAHDDIVKSSSKQTGVDANLIWAIMKSESAFRKNVVSKAGAIGLMQLMPTTAKLMSKNMNKNFADLYSPKDNIEIGTYYLSKLIKMFKGNIHAAIASYNAGEDVVSIWMKKAKMMNGDEWIEEIPYSETNTYVKKVMSGYWNYTMLYGNKMNNFH